MPHAGGASTCPRSFVWGKKTMVSSAVRRLSCGLVLAAALSAASAEAQVVYYEPLRPVVAAPVMMAAPVVASPSYVANYTPSGNYAAVTAFSPPVVAPATGYAVRTAYAPAYAPVAVTSYYAPVAAPVTAYYAPAAVEPMVTAAPVAAVAPVTAYYAPAAVAMPLYRRGPLGVYRPVRTAYYIPY